MRSESRPKEKTGEMWVHVREAAQAGINRNRQCYIFPPTPVQSYARHGLWWGNRDLPGLSELQEGDSVRFRALIGAYRVYKPKLDDGKSITFVTVWTGVSYRQLVLSGAEYRLKNASVIEGMGSEECVQRSHHVRVKTYKLVTTYEYTGLAQKCAYDI